jgi:hypothetical protein
VAPSAALSPPCPRCPCGAHGDAGVGSWKRSDGGHTHGAKGGRPPHGACLWMLRVVMAAHFHGRTNARTHARLTTPTCCQRPDRAKQRRIARAPTGLDEAAASVHTCCAPPSCSLCFSLCSSLPRREKLPRKSVFVREPLCAHRHRDYGYCCSRLL